VGRLAAERRPHRRRTVDELGRGRQQLEGHAPAGERAERQHALDRRHAGAGDEHPGHGASAPGAAATPARSPASAEVSRGSTSTGWGAPLASASDTLPSSTRCIGP
jgi:hypothetical protein